jgi:drug/metabolite transporter (DMT)-like permease
MSRVVTTAKQADTHERAEGLDYARMIRVPVAPKSVSALQGSLEGGLAASAFGRALPLVALFTGALGIASSGIFVRLSETGPTATAFWRGALALPLLALWAWLEPRRGDRGSPRGVPARDARFFWAGLFFAGDLALWHWSLLLTTIAASTLEANLAPIFVTLIAWLAWHERPNGRFLLALALALGGVLLIVSNKLGHGSRALLGDALGIGTACFYAGYIAVVSRLRATYGTGVVMASTTLVFTLLLLPLALTQKFLPDTASGWMLLVGLALLAQFFGQGLIAYALAHLPATFGSVGLYVQPIAAAIYARIFLGERLAPVQILGACIVLGAIALARAAKQSVSPIERGA